MTTVTAQTSITINSGGGGGGGGATQVFSYPDFSSTSGLHYFDAAAVSGGTLYMMNNQGHNTSACYYTTQQPPNSFTTKFSFSMSGLGGGSPPVQSGFVFIIENTPQAGNQTGSYGLNYSGDANTCGYGGATNQNTCPDSIAIKFDASSVAMQSYPPGGTPSSTGLYFNGGPEVQPGHTLGLVPWNDLNPSGINFYSGQSHTYDVTIVYDGSLLTMVLEDVTSGAQMRFAWPLNLANTTNASGNWVGFSCGTAAQGVIAIHNWTYWNGYNTRLATPTFSPTAGQYSGTQTVTINYPAGSTCYYTTNGLLPTSASTVYSGPITVSANEVVQAVAIESGFTDSLVGTAIYKIGTSNTINYPSGFSAGNLITAGYAYLSGGAYRVSDTQGSTAGAAWFPAPVSVSSFSTSFTLDWGGSGQAMCFVLQNNMPTGGGQVEGWSGGPTIIGLGDFSAGYGALDAYNQQTNAKALGLLNSVCLYFDQSKNPNSVGLYTGGDCPLGSGVASGLNFASGGSFNVTLTYSGSTLSISMQSTGGGAIFNHSWTINIPSTVGANTAYAGFTGGSGGSAAVAAITKWTM